MMPEQKNKQITLTWQYIIQYEREAMIQNIAQILVLFGYLNSDDLIVRLKVVTRVNKYSPYKNISAVKHLHTIYNSWTGPFA